ncbi:MAG: GrpB family protein [Planctomycetota bacterium]
MSQPFRLMSYNPAWKQEFEQTRSSLLQATIGWLVEVEHIGATSVPGSIGRPVIDVLAGLTDLQALTEVADLIEGLNYRRIETPPWCDDELCALLVRPRSGEITHTVLVTQHQQELWKLALSVRNKLRGNAELCERLSQLKSNCYNATCSAESEMQVAKDEFFSSC